MPGAVHTSTLDRLLTSELAEAVRLLEDVKAHGPQLVALNLALEALERSKNLHQQIQDRIA